MCYSLTSHIRKSVIRNCLLSGHENQRRDWQKLTFCLQYLKKIYNKNLRSASTAIGIFSGLPLEHWTQACTGVCCAVILVSWVFDNIPSMNLVKTWVINTLLNPRVGPTFSKSSSWLYYNNFPHAQLCLNCFCSTSMAVQRVYTYIKYPVLCSK